jgi:heat shock protein HslJ
VHQTVTLTKDGKVFGDGGCNRFIGGYTIKGSQIFVGPLASTMMACPDAQMRAEATLFKGLQETTGFTATPRTLKLTGPTQTVVLRMA